MQNIIDKQCVGGIIYESYFMIEMLIKRDIGIYICIVVNVIGFVLRDVKLGNG